MKNVNPPLRFKEMYDARPVEEKLTDCLESFRAFVMRNERECAIALSAAGSIIVWLIRGQACKRNLDHYCYDNRLGHYWKLKRALSNTEWLIVESRKQNGERLGDILKDMHVLK